jgi:hypothetical protein
MYSSTIYKSLSIFLLYLQAFKLFVNKSLGASTNRSNWRKVKSKVQWAVSMGGEVREMRAVVTMKIVSLSVLLAIPTW